MEKGGVERPRPSRVLLPPAPQAGACAIPATTAFQRLADYSRPPRELRGSPKRRRGSVSVNHAITILHAVADRPLVNIQSDVIHSLHGGASLVSLNQLGR